MNYLTHSNRGAIVEQIMNNTSIFYRENKIAYFRKANPAYAHISKQNKNYSGSLFEENNTFFQIKLTEKGDVDYYGIYAEKYFAIELKETKQETFSLSQLKEHQFSQLEKINYLGGISLILVHFIHELSSFWIITFPQLKQLLNMKKAKKFSSSELEKIKAYKLEIIYPHIFNLQPILDEILKNYHSKELTSRLNNL